MLMIQLFHKKYKFCNRNHKKHLAFFFFFFYGLKIKKAKFKIAEIGVLKGVKLALCGMECVNLNDVIKIFGICYSYDKKLENGKNVHIIKHIILNHIIKL